jgi:hypothetical protein
MRREKFTTSSIILRLIRALRISQVKRQLNSPPLAKTTPLRIYLIILQKATSHLGLGMSNLFLKKREKTTSSIFLMSLKLSPRQTTLLFQ